MNHLHRIEALVLTVLLLPLVLIARLVARCASHGRFARLIPEPSAGTKQADLVPASPTKQAPQPAPAAPVAPLPVAPMVLAACTAPAPAAGRQAPPLATLTTVQLRRLAQERGFTTIAGRRCSKARKADLLAALA